MTTNQKRFFRILDEPAGRETFDEHEMSAWRSYDLQGEWLRAADSIKW